MTTVAPRITGEILIDRPISDVFDFVADERNEPRYNQKMTRVEKLTEGPIGAGTRYLATVTSGRGATDMTIETTEYERPYVLGSVTTLDSMTIRGTLRFEDVGGATRMSWVWDLTPRGALRFLSPLVAAMGRRQEKAIWSGLKRELESGGRTA